MEMIINQVNSPHDAIASFADVMLQFVLIELDITFVITDGNNAAFF